MTPHVLVFHENEPSAVRISDRLRPTGLDVEWVSRVAEVEPALAARPAAAVLLDPPAHARGRATLLAAIRRANPGVPIVARVVAATPDLVHELGALGGVLIVSTETRLPLVGSILLQTIAGRSPEARAF